MPRSKKPTPALSADAPPITIRALRPKDFAIIERLFGPKGACGGCWCMAWRVPSGGKAWKELQGDGAKESFRQLVECGTAHGVLAFSGDEPVGWCSFGPREDFPRLLKSRVLQTDWTDDTWSIVCFYLPAKWRGQGVGTELLKAATEEAFRLGAKEIEGYPVTPTKSPMPAAFAWTGVPALFKAAGYRHRKRAGETRPIYVKQAVGRET